MRPRPHKFNNTSKTQFLNIPQIQNNLVTAHPNPIWGEIFANIKNAEGAGDEVVTRVTANNYCSMKGGRMDKQIKRCTCNTKGDW